MQNIACKNFSEAWSVNKRWRLINIGGWFTSDKSPSFDRICDKIIETRTTMALSMCDEHMQQSRKRKHQRLKWTCALSVSMCCIKSTCVRKIPLNSIGNGGCRCRINTEVVWRALLIAQNDCCWCILIALLCSVCTDGIMSVFWPYKVVGRRHFQFAWMRLNEWMDSERLELWCCGWCWSGPSPLNRLIRSEVGWSFTSSCVLLQLLLQSSLYNPLSMLLDDRVFLLLLLLSVPFNHSAAAILSTTMCDVVNSVNFIGCCPQRDPFDRLMWRDNRRAEGLRLWEWLSEWAKGIHYYVAGCGGRASDHSDQLMGVVGGQN